MEHGNGSPQFNSPQVPFLGTPDDAIVVYAGTPDHRYAAPMKALSDGTPVIVSGTVTEAREHGSIDAPRLTFVLANDLGHGTYAAVDTNTLDTYSMCLLDETEVTVYGHVRKPFDDGPPYLSVYRVEPLID